jgi:mannosylglycerate hydrolase
VDLQAAAAEVLRGNDEGRYTTPSRLTYPHQWNWDSALCALGWAELDPARAWTELESLLGARDARSGMVPHIAFHPDATGRGIEWLVPVARPYPRYLPGPRWWGPRRGLDGRRTSAITQPPLAATCARLLFERAPDEPRARALLAPLAGWHRFLLGRRDPDGHAEPVLIHAWESGRDNAVEWDPPLWRVTPEVTVVSRADTVSVDAAERPSDEHYRRFLSLVRQGTREGWPQERLAREGQFRVLDPGFSAILARAALDLAWLADQLGEPRLAEESRAASEQVASALRARLSSEGLIEPVDLMAGPVRVRSAGSAMALLTPGLPERAVRAGLELVTGALASEVGVRSLDRDHPEVNPRNYWRGPAWVNLTWMCAHALSLSGEEQAAGHLRERMLAAVEDAGMREYFDPTSGRGLGARDFAWTAALTLRDLGSDTVERR